MILWLSEKEWKHTYKSTVHCGKNFDFSWGGVGGGSQILIYYFLYEAGLYMIYISLHRYDLKRTELNAYLRSSLYAQKFWSDNVFRSNQTRSDVTLRRKTYYDSMWKIEHVCYFISRILRKAIIKSGKGWKFFNNKFSQSLTETWMKHEVKQYAFQNTHLKLNTWILELCKCIL